MDVESASPNLVCLSERSLDTNQQLVDKKVHEIVRYLLTFSISGRVD